MASPSHKGTSHWAFKPWEGINKLGRSHQLLAKTSMGKLDYTFLVPGSDYNLKPGCRLKL